MVPDLVGEISGWLLSLDDTTTEQVFVLGYLFRLSFGPGQ